MTSVSSSWLWLIALATSASAAQRTALDRYVAAPDTAYSYRCASTVPGDGYTAYILEMTSQQWLTTNEVNQPIWRHWMTIVRPESVLSSTGLLFIGGGSNEKPAPTKPDGNLARIAVATKTVVTELKLVPNQPLVFVGDGQPRSEDSLIAYTWDKYLRTGDERWPARLPMTKSAVRAMDTITSFCQQGTSGAPVQVSAFVVSGGSKRGWTTWTTAATDRRVVGIVPIVIDLLNLEPSFIHHFECYGFYAPAVDDYSAMGIMDWQGTREYRNLMNLVEPYSYRNRLTMPKFLINATGDQFFLPDSSQFYFDDLRGVKYLRYVPNADHSLKDSDAWETLLACYHAVVNEKPLPRFKWEIRKDGSIKVVAKDRPQFVKLWQATNPTARDFRLETLGKAWTATTVAPAADGSFVGKVAAPDRGWTAFMVELTFPCEGLSAPFKFTSGVKVLPETKPFKYAPKPNRPGTPLR